jgi:hypothetical protein
MRSQSGSVGAWYLFQKKVDIYPASYLPQHLKMAILLCRQTFTLFNLAKNNPGSVGASR